MKQNTLKNNKFQALWIAIHGLVFLALGIMFLCGIRYKINTNLFDILPKTNASRDVSKADGVMGSKTGRVFIVLVKGPDLVSAKKAACDFNSLLEEESNKACFEKISLLMDNNMTEVSDYFLKNRYFLLNEAQAGSLYTNNGVHNFIDDSLMTIYSSFGNIRNLEEDPFALSEMELMEGLGKLMENGTSMSMLDGVLCTYKDDNCYVMLRGSLTPEGASITNKNSGVKKIYECAAKVKESPENSEIEFIYSGVPFHSYESSSSAQKEITIISVVSMILIILLCIYFFRNGLPVISSVGAITLSAVFALSCVLCVFKEIHILTFVFGTTLIGTCLDYSVHYFVRWKGDMELNSGVEIRKHLFKGITLSLISTELCYILLCFAPFALLKQVAVFSFSGILSSYLTVICMYPLFKNPKAKKEIPLTKLFNAKKTGHKNIKKFIFAGIVTALAVVFVFARKNIRIENDLKSFYTMKGDLLKSEIEANTVLNSGSNGWYFIVKGNSKDQVLENERKLCKKLDDFIEANGKGTEMTYNSISKYIPTKSIQEKSYKSIVNLFDEILPQYIDVHRFDAREAIELKEKFIKDYKAQEGKYIDLENDIPEFMKDAISNLWIGEVDGEWFSVVMPMHITDEVECRQIAANDENVFFVNKVKDVGTELNSLTKLMLLFLAIAFVAMIIIMFFFYKFKKVLKIILIPLVTVFACVSVLGAFNVPLGFFSVTGIILVFGLSIDYIIYAMESSETQNSIAILLSFISSAISFGALALSSFAPVYMFGLAVFVGLTTAVLCTMLVKE